MSSCALLLAFAHRGFVSQQAVSELNAQFESYVRRQQIHNLAVSSIAWRKKHGLKLLEEAQSIFAAVFC